jgi:hypothetical protein
VAGGRARPGGWPGAGGCRGQGRGPAGRRGARCHIRPVAAERVAGGEPQGSAARERSRLAGGGNHRPFGKKFTGGTPADRAGRTRGAAAQARLRSRGVTARRRVPQVMRLGGRATVNSQSRDAASRKTTITGESAGQPRMPRFETPRYRPAVRGRQPRPLSLARLALTDPSEYGLRLRPPTGAAGYSSGDSPWKATHTG